MRREELEHVIRAAAAIAREKELVILGASSLLGAVPDPPEELTRSRDVDLYPLRRPELADVIDGSIGEASLFEEEFGYYAHGVGPETAALPSGWESRLVKIDNENTQHSVGYCLDPHDLAASKLAAGREKDMQFVAAMMKHGIVNERTLRDRVSGLPLPMERRRALELWMARRDMG